MKAAKVFLGNALLILVFLFFSLVVLVLALFVTPFLWIIDTYQKQRMLRRLSPEQKKALSKLQKVLKESARFPLFESSNLQFDRARGIPVDPAKAIRDAFAECLIVGINSEEVSLLTGISSWLLDPRSDL